MNCHSSKIIKKQHGNFGNFKSFLSFAFQKLSSLETLVRIKENAHGLFMKYGFRSVTMDEIAQRMGISKKTIYTYFEDKDALVDAIMVDEIAMNVNCCEADRKNALNAVHEIFLAIQMMQKTMADMNPMVLFELNKNQSGKRYSRRTLSPYT
jgi:TetR/AcrR family transcriptional regulator, cholesterol catabolism regulator